MPPSSSAATYPPPLVVVIDTSALIEIKNLVELPKVWGVLNHMSGLVEVGRLAYPRHVIKELATWKFADAPGAWGTAPRGQRHPPAKESSIVEVLAVAPMLVNPEVETKGAPADPYVVAMAWEIRDRYPKVRVVVATNDHVDRLPLKESMATACERLGLEWWMPQKFVDWVCDDMAGNHKAPPKGSGKLKPKPQSSKRGTS